MYSEFFSYTASTLDKIQHLSASCCCMYLSCCGLVLRLLTSGAAITSKYTDLQTMCTLLSGQGLIVIHVIKEKIVSLVSHSVRLGRTCNKNRILPFNRNS